MVESRITKRIQWNETRGRFFSFLPENGFDNVDDVSFLSSPVREFVVLGGVMANNGESEASLVVHDHKHSLERVVYLPSRTKGGTLVRPHYHSGDRQGRDTFSNLIELWCSPPPHLYGWDAPQLWRVVIGSHWVSPPTLDEAKSMIEAVNPKLEAEMKSLRQSLLRAYPALEQIDIGGITLPDLRGRLHLEHRWVTPIILSWEVHRVLLAAVIKEDSTRCAFACLPLELLNEILARGLRRRWFHSRATQEELMQGTFILSEEAISGF